MATPQKKVQPVAEDTSAWTPVKAPVGGDSSNWSPVDPPPTPPVKPESLSGSILDFGNNALRGISQGGLQTLTGLSKPLHDVGEAIHPGVGESLAPEAGMKSVRDATTPKNTTQSIFKTGEQVAEWLLPTGLEEKAGVAGAKLASRAAEYAPRLAKFIEPAAKIGTSALESGARNVTQGGDFTTGAAIGAGGSAVGQGLQKAAPFVAEKAMKVGQRLRGGGRTGGTIGRAMLDNTTAINPTKVGEQAGDAITAAHDKLIKLADESTANLRRIKGYLPAAEQDIPLAAHVPGDMPGGVLPADTRLSANKSPYTDAPTAASEADLHDPQYLTSHTGPEVPHPAPYEQGVMRGRQAPNSDPLPEMFQDVVSDRGVDLNPARQHLYKEGQLAGAGNDHAAVTELQTALDDLNFNPHQGRIYDQHVSARDAVDLKHGLGNRIETLFGKPTADSTEGALTKTHGLMDEGLNKVLPEAEPLNEVMSNLRPIRVQGKALARGDSPFGSVASRVAAHGSAGILGTIAGSKIGEGKKRSTAGGIVGGLAGLIAPSVLTSPTFLNAIARIADSPATQHGLTGIAAQADRKNSPEWGQ
jgi:hypothetical protein